MALLFRILFPILLNWYLISNSFFYQMCFSSLCVPDSFLCGSVTSLLKKGKDPVSCSSYRPIKVACTLSKLFEHLLLPYITKLALNYDNQFGFRSGLGCQHL